MNIRQLQGPRRPGPQSGGDATTALVDIQFNLAFPLVNLIVVLMGIVLASGPRKTTIASGFGLTLLVSFGYYLFMNFGRALGHNGTLAPGSGRLGRQRRLYAWFSWFSSCGPGAEPRPPREFLWTPCLRCPSFIH